MNENTSPSIPHGWQTAQVSEIAQVKGGKRLPAGEQFADAETPFPYLRVTDMVNGTINDSNIVFVKPEIEPLIRQYKISADDLYATIAGTLGQFGRIPDQLDGSQLTENAVKISDIDSTMIDTDYLCYFLRSDYVTRQVQIATGTGAGVPKLPLYQVERLRFQFPRQVPEQRKIARILTTVDNLIEQTEGLIEKYKSIKQGMMHDLFTRGVDSTGQLRPSYEDAPELYKESELGWIPKEWEEKLLIEIASYQTGSAFPSADYGKEGIRLLRPGNLQVDEYVQWDDGHTTFLPLKWRTQASEYLLSGGEIVMNLTAQSLEDQFLGRVCLTPLGAESLLNQRIAKIRPRSCDHGFLFWAFKGPRFRFQVDRLTQGTKVQHIYNSNLNAIGIAIPAKQHEQKEIAQRLFTITNQIRSEVESRNKLQLIKSGLMQDLLTGKVRVNVDETEEVTADV